MKTVELISRILNFSIVTLAILGVGLFGLGQVMYVRSDASDVLIVSLFLLNLSWVLSAVRCYAHSDEAGVKLPMIIQIVNALTFGCYGLLIIAMLVDLFICSTNAWVYNGGSILAMLTCGLMVIDWIVCSLYLNKYVKEEYFALNKRSVAWLGGALLLMLSGMGAYGIYRYNKPIWYGSLSERIVENHYRYSSNKLFDKEMNKTVLEDYTRLVFPRGTDSLALFFKDGKRGYINLHSGEIIVPATTYTHAWVFSEGLAAVEKDGKIGFINPQGEVVIDFQYEYDKSKLNSFGFHHDRCLMLGENKKKGLIDQQGNWKVQPEYDYLTVTSNYAVVGKKGELKKMVDFDGHVLQENIFDSSHVLKYERHYLDEDGHDQTQYQYVKGICVYRIDGVEGLMTDDARIITPPVYESIRAYDDQHFVATLLDSYSEVWLNRKGEIINSQN